jgi:hypothetical protein
MQEWALTWRHNIFHNLICCDHTNIWMKHASLKLCSFARYSKLIACWFFFIGRLQCYFLRWSNAIKNWHGALTCHSGYWVTVREG